MFTIVNDQKIYKKPQEINTVHLLVCQGQTSLFLTYSNPCKILLDALIELATHNKSIL
jgi:hypothetical protein